MTPRLSPEPVLTVSQLDVSFPIPTDDLLVVIDKLSFQVYPQEFISILGPSGCGKTTLLRVIAGLISKAAGNVTYNGKKDASAYKIGLVFQQANLMPWRTVFGNVSLPLEIAGYQKGEIPERVNDMIHLVGLEGFERTYPCELSGGMAQRVAIARALVQDPDFLLLDEPFGSLDALTRERMGNELLSIWQARRKTVLMVTHSISEAVFLSDRVIVLTPRPARVNLNLSIDLPRPRDEKTRYRIRFSALTKKLRQAIVDEVY